MRCLGICIPVLAIVLLANHSASADQYVVYGRYWQEGTDAPAQAPTQAPAAEPKDELMQAPTAGCGCGEAWSSCGDCNNCCSGWWAGYCRERHQWCHRRSACSDCDMGCGSYEVSSCGGCGDCYAAPSCGCGHHRLHHRRGGYSCYDSGCDVGCGCSGKAEGAVEGKSDLPMEPPAPTPDEAGAGEKSARGFGRFHRW